MGRRGRLKNFRIGPSLSSNRIGMADSNSNLEALQVPNFVTINQLMID